MCSIYIGVPGEDQELQDLNKGRGHSDSEWDLSHLVVGKDLRKHAYIPSMVTVGHQRAATTKAGGAHPARNRGLRLWHNGIIKGKQLESWQPTKPVGGMWDTAELLDQIEKLSYEKAIPGVPDDVDGSFACVLLHQGILYLFRNHYAPLYAQMFQVSSVKGPGMELIPPGEIHKYPYRRSDALKKFKITAPRF